MNGRKIGQALPAREARDPLIWRRFYLKRERLTLKSYSERPSGRENSEKGGKACAVCSSSASLRRPSRTGGSGTEASGKKESILADTQPEVAYFGSVDGNRGGYLVINM